MEKEINSLNLQGQCFKISPWKEGYISLTEIIKHSDDIIILKVIRHSGNQIYCLKGMISDNNKSLVSSTEDVSTLEKCNPITKEEFDLHYTQIKREVEGTIQEAEFV